MFNSESYSAAIRIFLDAGDREIPVASCYHNTCRLLSPTRIPPGVLELVIVIDGIEDRIPIRLEQEISDDIIEIEFKRIDVACKSASDDRKVA